MYSFVLAFFFGITVVHLLENLPSPQAILFIFMGYIVVASVILKKISKMKQLFCLLFVGFCCGFIVCYITAYSVLQSRLPAHLEGVPLLIKGSIVSIPIIKKDSAQFEFLVDEAIPLRNIEHLSLSAIEDLKLWKTPSKIKLSWREVKPEAIQVGDEWQFSVNLKRSHGYANPGGFDKERQDFQNRIVAWGNVIYESSPQLLKSTFFNRTIDRVRVIMRDHIRQVFSTQDKSFSGLIEALVIGTRDKVTDQQWLTFQNTGTSHLMAISGLHVGMVASITFLFIVFSLKRVPIVFLKSMSLSSQTIAAVISLITALFYSALAGFSVPTQRALIMIFMMMLHIFMKRKISVWRSYSIALTLVLLIDPLSVLGVGFWLSFAAVGIMLYGMQKRIALKTLWWKWGRAQWVVFLGLLPLSIWSFQKFSIISPLINSLAIPWVSWFVVPFALLGCFVSIFSLNLSSIILIISEKMLSLLWPLLDYSSQMQHATFNWTINSSFILIVVSIGILWMLAPKGFPGRRLSVITLVALFGLPPTIPKETAHVSILDVGQGLAIVVETAKHTLVFDAGPKWSDTQNAGSSIVIPFLNTRNIQKIDALIISHGDLDHIGGAAAILGKYPVNQILTSEPWLFEEAEYCKAGQHWEWDGVMFDMLHPSQVDEPYYKKNVKRNDQSCVLRIQAGNHSVLITGDIEAKSEKAILENWAMLKNQILNKNTQQNNINHNINVPNLKSTVLLVPHHGSKTSSSQAFIDAVEPQYAVISAGYRNAYGHPKEEVVKRYKGKGIQILDSIKGGAIQFLLGESGDLFPKQYRIDHKHYWAFKD